MSRRLNYTGRRSIDLSDVQVRILQDGDDLRFDADVRLEGYKFPTDASLHVEAYRGLSALWKRFDFGRVGLIQPPADRSLKEFDHPQGILFRVKVVAAGADHGKIFGEADGIRPQLPDEERVPAQPLIDVDRGPLGGDPWIVSFPDSPAGMPHLIINERIEDWSTRARDPLFRALVLPGVMRQILTQILIISGIEGSEDAPEEWPEKWLRFAEGLPGMRRRPDPLARGGDLETRVDVSDWINDAVSAFGNRSGLMDQLLTIWKAD